MTPWLHPLTSSLRFGLDEGSWVEVLLNMQLLEAVIFRGKRHSCGFILTSHILKQLSVSSMCVSYSICSTQQVECSWNGRKECPPFFRIQPSTTFFPSFPLRKAKLRKKHFSVFMNFGVTPLE